MPGFGQVLLSIAIQVTFLYSLPVLSDPLGIITSAYFFVCKIGMIVRWVYICELMLLNFHAKDKCFIPMGEVPYYCICHPDQQICSIQLPRQYYQLIMAQKKTVFEEALQGSRFPHLQRSI